MFWIVIAALLVVFFLDNSVALAVAVAVMAWLGFQLQRQAQQIKQLTERLDKLDPTSAENTPEPTVALANTSISTGPAGQRSDRLHDSPAVADPVDGNPTATTSPPIAEQVTNESAGHTTDSTGNLLAPLKKLVIGYFTGGNLIVRIGVVVLFFGLSFLAKFSIENGLIPVEWRLAAIATVACALLAFGWRLKDKSPAYALVLQGAGVAALYLVVFSALRLYQLLPPMLAFALLLLISIFAMLLAVKQNSRALAITAITGAFACPILTSDGSGNYIALFSYYALLNFTVFSIAWFKSWRLLNLIAFAFTFLVATAWGALRYEPQNYQSAQLFLVLFALQFIAIAIVFAWRQPPRLRGLVDGTLIFGTPLIGFGLQAQLVEPFEYGLAWSALALGVFYLLLGALLWWRANTALRLLAESFVVLGLIFCTLAIPLAFDALWTSAAWAIEGTAFVWLAQRQKKLPLLWFGYLLQAGAFGFFLYRTHGAFALDRTTLLGVAMLAVCALVTGWLTTAGALPGKFKETLANGFAGWGLLLWYGGIGLHGMELLSGVERHLALLLFIAGSGVIGWAINRRAKLPVLEYLPWAGAFLLACIFLTWPGIGNHGDWLKIAAMWIAAMSAHYFVLHQRKPPRSPSANWLHAVSWILLIVVASQLAHSLFQLHDTASAWRHASSGLLLAIALAAPVLIHRWPFSAYPRAFRHLAATVILGVMLLWTLGNIGHVLTPAPLPYLPLLNPMDLCQLIVLGSFLIWRLKVEKASPDSELHKNWWLAGGLAVFAWATSLLLKSLHVWQAIPYTPGDLFYSPTVQTSLSIFWTIVGLCTAVYATRSHRRIVWFCAAALIAVVVAKLFLIDLTDQDSITRIASFVGVGGLLLVVGYFAPLPPTAEQANADVEPS